jgi:protein TonB
MKRKTIGSHLVTATQRVLAICGALVLTLAFFLVLPLIQAITDQPSPDRVLYDINTAIIPPPPPPPEDEPEPEDEEEESPPDLAEEAPLLDLAQLEIALEPGLAAGLLGDFTMKLGSIAAGGEEVDALFTMADLDQEPRVIYQPGPEITQKLRARGGGSVRVLFIVDQRGRVQSPIVQSSPDPIYERPAIETVKRWRFEPGKRHGEAVRFRMRVSITFPKE